MTRPNLATALQLVLVTDRDAAGGDAARLLELVAEAVAGGVTAVQARDKRATPRELAALVRALQQRVTVPIFVNDRLDVALASGADGVHLGADDLAPRLARRIAPADFCIGASVGGPDEVSHAEGADYWGIGPLRSSQTKSDAGPPLGQEGVEGLIRSAGDVPIVVIGGVLPEDLAWAGRLGIGAAVSAGILRSPDPRAAAAAYHSRRGSVAS